MSPAPRRTNLQAVDGDSGVFDARAAVAQAEVEYPPFPFIGLDGQTYHLPNPLMLHSGDQVAVLEAQANASPESAELALRTLFGEKAPEALAAMDAMPSIVVARLMEAWNRQAEEAMGLGEVPGAPLPPNRAARRSKPISRSGASTSGRSTSTK
jgi:hypothetical protein